LMGYILSDDKQQQLEKPKNPGADLQTTTQLYPNSEVMIKSFMEVTKQAIVAKSKIL